MASSATVRYLFHLDHLVSSWARQLRKAGLDGDMNVLRARAYLDLLLGKDSRPTQDAGGAQAGAMPAGFAGKITLTIPLATPLGLAERPAEIPGIGPIDPNPGANTPDRYQAVTRDAY